MALVDDLLNTVFKNIDDIGIRRQGREFTNNILNAVEDSNSAQDLENWVKSTKDNVLPQFQKIMDDPDFIKHLENARVTHQFEETFNTARLSTDVRIDVDQLIKNVGFENTSIHPDDIEKMADSFRVAEQGRYERIHEVAEYLGVDDKDAVDDWLSMQAKPVEAPKPEAVVNTPPPQPEATPVVEKNLPATANQADEAIDGEFIAAGEQPKAKAADDAVDSTATPNDASGGRAATAAENQDNDFPKFDPKIDKFKVAAHFGITDTTIPLPRVSFFPVAAMRARSYGITRPVIDYVSSKMNNSGITEALRGLDKDILAKHKNGANKEEIKSVINDFATKNEHALEEFSQNIGELRKHVDSTYKTNSEINNKTVNKITITGEDSTHWKHDLNIGQKDALIEYLDHMENLMLDIAQGTNGNNSKEIFSTLEQITDNKIKLRDVNDSVTGLSRASEIANHEHIRETGKWLDGSGEATKQYKEKLIRGINSGFYTRQPHAGKPIIWNINNYENMEKVWQDWIEDHTSLKDGSTLNIRLTSDVKPMDGFLSSVDTLVGAGFIEEALIGAEQLTRILQTKLDSGTIIPFPDDSEFDYALTRTGRNQKADPRTNEAYRKLEEIFKIGTDRIGGAHDPTALGLKENFWGVNRYTLTKAERETYFLETATRHGKDSANFGTGIGKPAWISMKSKFLYDTLYNPLTFLLGGRMNVDSTLSLTKRTNDYYKGRHTEFRFPKDSKNPDGDKESIFQPIKRSIVRIGSAALPAAAGVVPIPLLNDIKLTENKWLFGQARILLPRPTKWGYLVGAALLADSAIGDANASEVNTMQAPMADQYLSSEFQSQNIDTQNIRPPFKVQNEFSATSTNYDGASLEFNNRSSNVTSPYYGAIVPIEDTQEKATTATLDM